MLKERAPIIAHAAFAAGVLVYGVHGLTQLAVPVFADYWEHLATIGAFARDPIHPENPYVAGGGPTHLFTPHHFFWGVVMRIFHATPLHLAVAIGGAYLALFFIGVFRFSDVVLRDRRLAIPVAVALLSFWGEAWAWSGFYNLGLLPLCAPYPYWGVLGFALLWLARSASATRLRMRDAIEDVVAIAGAFVTHPLGGIFLGVTVALLRLERVPAAPLARRMVFVALPSVAGFALALLWPYYSVPQAIGAAGHYAELEFAGPYRMFYERLPSRFGFAALGIVPVVLDVWRKNARFTTRGLALFAAVYALNYVAFHSPVLSRFIIFVLFFLQLGVVVFIANDIPAKWRPLAFGAFALVGLYTLREQARLSQRWLATTAKASGEPAADSEHRATSYASHLAPADVLLARLDLSFRYPALVPCKVVGVAHSNPFFKDFKPRVVAVRVFFDRRTTPGERDAILARYRVTRLLLTEQERRTLPVERATLWPLQDGADGTLYEVAFGPEP